LATIDCSHAALEYRRLPTPFGHPLRRSSCSDGPSEPVATWLKMAEAQAADSPSGPTRLSPQQAAADWIWTTSADIPLDHGGPVGVAFDALPADFTERSVLALFEAVVARDADAVAVADGKARLGYGQVLRAAQRLAGQIVAEVPAGRAVAILLPNTPSSIIALLACLGAGRCCLVLNANHPIERNATILRDSGAHAVIVAEDYSPQPSPVPEHVRRIVVPNVLEDSGEPSRAHLNPVGPDDAAIVLYTSGSTGRPKGIVLSQATILDRVRKRIVSMHLHGNDRVLSLGALCTTAGLIASVATLLSGGTQFIVSVSAAGVGSLLSLIRAERITILQGVPALLRLLFEADGARDALATLRVVRTSGERLLRKDLEVWHAISPPACDFGVAYGQTEISVSGWSVPREYEGKEAIVPAGYLAPGLEFAIVDEDGRRVPDGEVGELLIRSRYVALGEWANGRCVPGRARPDRVDARARILATGDLVRLGSDSLLRIVSRCDRQLKVNGQRVEPAEIEDALRNVPGVLDATIAVRRSGGDATLLAFIVAHDARDSFLLNRVRESVRRTLPGFMQPARVLQVERLPLLPGGKIDERALLAIEAATPRSRREPVSGLMTERPVIGAPATSSTFAATSLAWLEATVSLHHGAPGPYERLQKEFVNRSIYDLFEAVAARNEAAIALADSGGRLTYAQVRNAARQLAARVRVAAPSGKAVAVLLPNGAKSLIAALACLAADRVCILLNADHPAERNRAILRRAAVAALIVAEDDRAAAALAPTDAIRIPAVYAPDDPVENFCAPHPPRGSEPVIVLYTSGSTGEPKGIVLSEAAILWRLRNSIVQDLDRHDRVLCLPALDTTSGFFASLSGLLSGCLQFIVSVSTDGVAGLLSLIRAERVTILGGVPAVLRMLFEIDESVSAFAQLRVVRAYGERLPWADLVKWRATLPADCRIAIAYGQTEGYASAWFVPPTRASGEGAVPVGYLLPEQQYAIVDDAGNSVAPGEVGELIIRSRYVALGEWEDGQCKPGRARPDGSEAGMRLLSTGDLVRLDSDSLLHIVDRRDRQVKIRGQRVEPAEIEDVLRRVPDVTAAAVAVGREGEETVLFGFVVAQEDNADLRQRLRAALKQALPTYMHPARLFVVERLPLLPGGKVDPAALLALAAARPRHGGAPEPGLTATQRARDAVSQAWLRTLDRDSLDADIPFDEAGGDSLRLLRFVFHLEQQCGVTLPLDAFYAALRPSAFVERLDQRLEDLSTRSDDGRRPLFLLPGVGKDEPRLVRFRAACARELRVIPIDYGDWPDWIAPGFKFTAIVARIVAAIEAEAPDGPILLAGYSLGGKIAYAVALALLSGGRTIGFLGILDTDISSDEPEPGRWHRFTAAVRRGESMSGIASYLSRWLSKAPRPLSMWLVLRVCRARLPGDFGFYLHWHIRRRVLAHLVKTWWAQNASPLPQLRVPATLFRSMEHRTDAPADLSWSRICPEVTTVAVGGDHYTMFDPPNLEPLCGCFTASVKQTAVSTARS
jgi:acyl-coenzyme A synthetase/AMP-(fatty) acid ligase/thioesterase domain-containing protein